MRRLDGNFTCLYSQKQFRHQRSHSAKRVAALFQSPDRAHLLSAMFRSTLTLFLLCILCPAEVWPTYRHDNRRSGVSPSSLQLPLTEAWVHNGGLPQQAWTGPAKWDAYSSNEGLQSMRNFDPCYFTTAAHNLIYYGSSSDNALHCLDAITGEEQWQHFTNSSVRFHGTAAAAAAAAATAEVENKWKNWSQTT